MKTNKLMLGLATLTIMIVACVPITATADVQVGGSLRIVTQPKGDLEVYAWPDRGEGSVYYPGDPININVEVTRDCFLILYDIDTRGHLNILFPEDPWQSNFVAAGDAISFPRPQDDFTWSVDGPSGTEYVQAIASEIPISLPEWPVYQRPVHTLPHIGYDPDLRDFRAGDDRYDYMNIVNRNICGRYWDWTATDVASFYVHSQQRVIHVNQFDPWPNEFYGEVYIGWPSGATIYIDGIYIGIAPCWIPRHYVGRHVITCLSGPRVIRRQTVNVYPKRDFYRRDMPGNYREYVRVKKARPGAYEQFDVQRDAKGSRFHVVEKARVRDVNKDDGREVQYKSSRVGVSSERDQKSDKTSTFEKSRTDTKYGSKVEVNARAEKGKSNSKAERESSKHRSDGKSERGGRRK